MKIFLGHLLDTYPSLKYQQNQLILMYLGYFDQLVEQHQFLFLIL